MVGYRLTIRQNSFLNGKESFHNVWNIVFIGEELQVGTLLSVDRQQGTIRENPFSNTGETFGKLDLGQRGTMEKAPSPILSTLLGILISVSDEQ